VGRAQLTHGRWAPQRARRIIPYVASTLILERCSCGHMPAAHLIACGEHGPGIYRCEASTRGGGTCRCRQYSPRPPEEPEIDEELPWRAA
jgi:hypothetical protein